MYLTFYSLREEPFRLTPDPNFLYLTESHRAVLVAIIQGVVERRGLLVATGAVGSGKTLLLNTALQILTLTQQQIRKRRVESAFLVNPTLTREELLEAVLDDFEIKCASTSKPQKLAALREHLLETHRLGGTSVLIIDEAHLLTMELLEEIRLLGNLDTSSDRLLQIVLAGQPELDHVLVDPELKALRQRIAVYTRLRSLTPAEVSVYIAERIKIAGLISSHPFMEAAVERIYSLSEGVPRVINLLCDTCLRIGFQNQRLQIGPDIVDEAAFALRLKRTGELQRESPLSSPRHMHRHWNS